MYIHSIVIAYTCQGASAVSKMSKPKTVKKKLKKNSQLVLRINDAQRDRFVQLCDDLDTSAAREIRRFIGEFLETHSGKG